MFARSVLMSALVLFLSVVVGRAEAVWLTDYQAALKQAKAEDKRVLLDFTGSDWCGWCIKLKSEVFDTPAFSNYAKSRLVLVELDFPRGKSQSAAVKKQNEELAAKFNINGFPTIIILDANGKLLGQTGYRRGGPEKYIAELDKIR